MKKTKTIKWKGRKGILKKTDEKIEERGKKKKKQTPSPEDELVMLKEASTYKKWAIKQTKNTLVEQ